MDAAGGSHLQPLLASLSRQQEQLVAIFQNLLPQMPATLQEDMEKISYSIQKLGELLKGLDAAPLPTTPEGWSHRRHDVRTPLNAIKGYGEMVLEDLGTLNAPLPLQEECRRMLHLADSIQKDLGQVGPPTAAIPLRANTPSLSLPQTPASSKKPTLKGRILVVDDTLENRQLLERRLKDDGHTILLAAGGEDALSILGQHQVDVVLLDLLMPGLNGFEVLQLMKNDPALRHLPIIMVSAVDRLEQIASCIEAGAEDYLPKPFNLTLLRARIGACLDKKAHYEKEQTYLRTLSANQRILEAAIESMEHGFALFDQAGVCTLRNTSFDRLYTSIDLDTLNPFTYQTFVQRVMEKDFYHITDKEEWQHLQLQQPLPPRRSLLQPLVDGRWLEIEEYTTVDQTRVVIHKDITQWKEDEQKLAYMAYHDPLTGLANRKQFQQELDSLLPAISPEMRFAIIYCDLDGFKQVNDTLGHAFGDLLLQHVAKMLLHCVRHKDLVARLGGDEFALILHRVNDEASLKGIIDRIFQQVGRELTIDGKTATFGLSMGIALYPSDATTPAELIHCADKAMYAAKKAGKGTYRFYRDQR